MANKKRRSTKQLIDCTTSTLYDSLVKFPEIQRRRKRAGLTQAEAAGFAGWKSQQHWANVENGRSKNPRIVTLAIIARVLRCKVRDLINEDWI